MDQYSGATSTANSEAEGRLKVDAGGMKRKILKKAVNKGKGGIGDAASNIGKTVSGALKWGADKSGQLAKQTAQKAIETLKGFDKAKVDTPVAKPGADYHWDEDQRGWVANPKDGTGRTVKNYMQRLPKVADNSSADQPLSKYPEPAQSTIKQGLQQGKARFEPNPSGGEYIYSGDKSFGAKPAKARAIDPNPVRIKGRKSN